jgi:high-affinity iron transporter
VVQGIERRARGGIAALALVAAISWPGAAWATPRPQAATGAAERAGRVASLVVLAAGEYGLGVSVAGGRLSAPAEYQEARQFLARAAALFAELPPPSGAPSAEVAAAGPRLDSLARLVELRSPPARVRALAARAARSLAAGWGAELTPAPPTRPSVARGAALYRTECAACHGAAGRGDGPAAAGIEPPPADLTAPARAGEGTPARDFQVVTLGVPATRMKSWADQLSVQARWDLVAYVQTLRFGAAQVAEGKDLALGEGTAGSPVAARLREWSTLPAAARLSDEELERAVQGSWSSATGDTLAAAEARAIVAYARTLLGTPLSGLPAPDLALELGGRIARSDSLAGVAARLGTGGNVEGARAAALDAYMAFEGAETGLRSRNPSLTSRIEAAFGAFQDVLSPTDEAGAAPTRHEIETARARLASLLEEAQAAIRSPATAWSLATQSFVVILREGFEAILIIGAILTFLTRTGHERRRRVVHVGAVLAVAASFLTAWALQELLSVTPASQDVLEGITMLVAVAVLFSVSYWLLSRMEHDRWEAYLRGRMRRALGTGGGLALASVAFLAVYREGFETVLFYKALFGFSAGGHGPVVGGFVAGCAALAVIYVAFSRFGVRIPMRPFFGVTSGVLYYMAIVFVGKGVHELQEAGVVGATRLAGAPRVELLGVYPTLETVLAQVLLVGLLLAALWLTFGRGGTREGSGPEAGEGGGDAEATAPVS